MNCPKCKLSTQVTDSRKRKQLVVRRRRCSCGERFTTHEAIVVPEEKVIIDRPLLVKGLTMAKSAEGHWTVKLDEDTPDWAKKILFDL